MADAEEKAKAEKLAAAKKRVEQLKKKNAKKSGAKKDKPAAASAESPDVEEKTEVETTPTEPETIPEETGSTEEPATTEEPAKEEEDGEAADTVGQEPPSLKRESSITAQSRARSSSFRQAGPLSPLSSGAKSPSPEEGTTAPEIYRKQAARIEELEKENKRLVKEASDGEKRWKKAENELEDLREAEPLSKNDSKITAAEVEKLQAEIASLQRQNTQLQSQTSKLSRHGSSPSVSVTAVPADLAEQLASKSSTIESMEIEISNLRAQLDRVASGSSAEKEQINALEEKLGRSEKAAERSERELADLRKDLERTTAKAVKESSERTSIETKARALEREAEEAKAHYDELQKKAEALEKKVAALTTLHKEHDTRSQSLKKEHEKTEKESTELRAKLATIENENLRLKEEKERTKKRDAEGVDDAGVDELEDEERLRLEKKIRELEGEVFELRRGAWRDKRIELQGDDGMTSPGARFTDVDLGNGMSSPSARRRSLVGSSRTVTDYISSGFNAITGGGADDDLLEDDEDMEFDEEAFRLAQQEEAQKRIERVKEIKRGLKNWEGWRLDLVENRRSGGEGAGEVFEI